MRIAIIALNALPAIASKATHPSPTVGIGGLETFAWSLASGLAENDRDQVLFLVRQEKIVGPSKHKGVVVDSIYEPFRSIRESVSRSLEINGLRKLPRIKNWESSLLWKIPTLAYAKLFRRRYSEANEIQMALLRFHPDVIITLGVNKTSASLIESAKSRSIPIVLWLQSNADLEPRFFLEDNFVDRYGVYSRDARACLEQCPNIICQTQTQMELLQSIIEKGYITSSQSQNRICIANPIDQSRFFPSNGNPSERNGVLWIGRADRFHKRPLLAIEIAKQCPHIPFTMVLNPSDKTVGAEVRSHLPSNVKLIDYVPTDMMPELLGKSKLFLSTGSAAYEGFPNVFLEAAASGTPIVSLEDFDHFLARSQSGIATSENLPLTVQTIETLYRSHQTWLTHSTAGLEYVTKHHQRSMVLQAFRDWLDKIMLILANKV